MRPFKELIDFDEAKRIVMERAEPISESEKVPVLEASGRVLAEKIIADRDVPGFQRAAMDGYAVIAEDTFGATRENPKPLRETGKMFAGEKPSISVEPNTCIQIATGAVMPGGADAVVMVEETEKEGDLVKVGKPVYPQQNVSLQNSDISNSQVLFEGGEYLTPARLGVIAALGLEKVLVRRKPKVKVFPTGNEIVPPGGTTEIGQIFDINSYTLASLIKNCGCDVEIQPIAGDTKEDLTSLIQSCTQTDIMIFSGGSSVGERDLLVDVVQEMGELLFHGVALKPGKPTIFGIVGGKMIFGMPGYPMSCLTNGYVLLAPALRQLSGVPDLTSTRQGKMTKRIVSTIGRHQILTVTIDGDQVTPVYKESGAITSISLANGYIEIPANVEFVEEGAEVSVTLF